MAELCLASKEPKSHGGIYVWRRLEVPTDTELTGRSPEHFDIRVRQTTASRMCRKDRASVYEQPSYGSNMEIAKKFPECIPRHSYGDNLA